MDWSQPIASGGTKYRMYAKRLAKLNILTFEDLILHIPFRYDDLSTVSDIKDLQPGETVTIKGEIVEFQNTYTRKKGFTIQRAKVKDATNIAVCTWFNQPFLTRILKEGIRVSVSGTVDKPGSLKVKDYEVLQSSPKHTGRLVPVYPTTKGVSPKWLRNRIAELLDSADTLPDTLPENIRKKYNYPKLHDALRKIHFPSSVEEAEQARSRLAFEELLHLQLAANVQKKKWREKKHTEAIDITAHREDIKKFFEALPFELTRAQNRAIEEVFHDLAQDTPMNRLLQGDVGAGKTVVAAAAMFAVVKNGYQAALMAPTEILAKQHHKTLTQLLEPLGIKVALFTSSVKMKERSNDFDIAVGTHALLHESIKFQNLFFITIDEQQRFGVEQRAVLREKGKTPHFLTMTATPIPRTVFLTRYGELSFSYLDELPKGRKNIKTWVVPSQKRADAHEWIKKNIRDSTKNSPSQVFIICPFIEESETIEGVKSAIKEFEELKNGPFKGEKITLLHGKMKGSEKDKILKDFRDHKYDVLVTTPVVEVGIDIPDASIMLIESADRFGLAQLHQLRGRVGRNDRQAYCLLFASDDTDISRLKYLETTHSGAELAEIDLKIRGPGEIYGTRQSGRFFFKLATLRDVEELNNAQQSAAELGENLENYPLLHEKVKSTIIRKISRD